MFLCESSNKPALLSFFGITLVSIVGLYFYDTYSGHDYYGLLALLKDISKLDTMGLIQFIVPLVIAALFIGFMLKDRHLLVITNESVLYF